MNLINLENLFISNLLFFYFFFTGGIIVNKFIQGDNLIRNSLNLIIGLTFYTVFLSILNIITNYNIRLDLLILIYTIIIIFYFKKSLLNKYFLSFLFTSLLILNILPFTVITYDSLLYNMIGDEYEFLRKNNLLENYITDSFTSILYLTYFYNYFSDTLILNIFHLVAFSMLFLIVFPLTRSINFTRKGIFFLFLIIVFCFSRNLIQHFFYLNSHLIVAITIFLTVTRHENIVFDQKIVLGLILSLIFLRVESFILLFIILFLNLFNFKENYFSKNTLILSILAYLLKIYNSLISLSEYSLNFNQLHYLLLSIGLITFLIKLIFFNTYKIKLNHKYIKKIYQILIIFFLISLFIDNDRMQIFFHNIFFDNFGWGLSWYLIFGYIIFKIFIKKEESYIFNFGVIYIFIIIFITNFTDMNLRQGFGDSSNRVLFHVMPIFFYEILNKFKKIFF